jgi:hypothetical protein
MIVVMGSDSSRFVRGDHRRRRKSLCTLVNNEPLYPQVVGGFTLTPMLRFRPILLKNSFSTDDGKIPGAIRREARSRLADT